MTEHLSTDRRPHVWTGNQQDGWHCVDVDCSATISAAPDRMTDDLPALLDSLEAAAAAATPGRWKLWGMTVMADQDGTSNVDTAVRVAQTFYRDERGMPRTWDASLICEMQRALPTLIAEMRRHQAAVQAVLDEADRLTVLGDDESADRIRAAVAALDPKEPS